MGHLIAEGRGIFFFFYNSIAIKSYFWYFFVDMKECRSLTSVQVGEVGLLLMLLFTSIGKCQYIIATKIFKCSLNMNLSFNMKVL